MNTENTKVMNKETIDLFNGKYCDVLISNNIVEDQHINFCVVGYDENESVFIIDKNGVDFELNCSEIDDVEVDNNKFEDIDITLTFSDGTTIVVSPLEEFEVVHRYEHELLMLELTRDRYKKELLEHYNN